MMFLTAAVVLVGILCAADLFLTFAVVRRLREHTAELERLAGLASSGRGGYDPSVLVGRSLPEPAAAGTGQSRLVGFFDANCSTCFEHAPEFAAMAGRQTLVAVVNGSGQKADELAGLLADVPAVRGEAALQTVVELDIQVFPMFVRVTPDGVISYAHAGLLSDMAEPVTV